MTRITRSITPDHALEALELVQEVFTQHSDEQEGRVVRRLVEEIRSKRFYVPALEITAVDEENHVIGYCMFSRFHLEGKYENELLLLSPVAVKTALQRRHISKDMIEFGFDLARQMGYKAVIVEGNPRNYRARGFVTAAQHGILPGGSVHLPHIDCLMAAELVPGAFGAIQGRVEYTDYDTLMEE